MKKKFLSLAKLLIFNSMVHGNVVGILYAARRESMLSNLSFAFSGGTPMKLLTGMLELKWEDSQ